MKKIYTAVIVLLLSLSVNISVIAIGWLSPSLAPVDATGQEPEDTDVRINVGTCRTLNGDKIELEIADIRRNWFNNLENETKDLLLNNAEEDDYMVVFGLVSDDEENPYPEIQPLEIQIETDSPVGNWRSTLLGRDYRLYYLENDTLEEIIINEHDDKMVMATVNRLSTYVLYYNPGVYSVTFYEDEIVEDENGYIINEEYYKVDNLRKYDTFDFPEIPTKDGYVFTGWKHNHAQGSTYRYEYVKSDNYFVDDSWGNWQVRAFDVREIYASWCPEEEFTPLEITIKSVEKITKGKEEGAEIILTLSEGRFYDYFENESYDREYGEIYGEDEEENYLTHWKSKWSIIGNDDIMIETVEKLDNTTLKFTLSGNSKDKYNTSQIQIGFESTIYSSSEKKPGSYNEYYEAHDIQLDENGIKKAMFISDNSITLEKQKRNTGGSSKPSSYTVEFNSNGGEVIENVKVERNGVVTEPEVPMREGYVFSGWYIDAELTKKYDFTSKVTEGFTLYAGWEEETTQDFSDSIIITPFELIEKILIYSIKLSNSIFK